MIWLCWELDPDLCYDVRMSSKFCTEKTFVMNRNKKSTYDYKCDKSNSSYFCRYLWT